jgi:hypothetical protein
MVKILLGAFARAVKDPSALQAANNVWLSHSSTSKSFPMRTMTGMSANVGAAGFGWLALRI